MCLLSFLVVYLTAEMGYSLVAAGLALTVANVGGVVGRIGWGASPTGSSARGCCWAHRRRRRRVRLPRRRVRRRRGRRSRCSRCARCSARRPSAGTASSSRRSRGSRRPARRRGHRRRGFITFAGVVVGPPAFALLAGLTGSYRAGFVGVRVAGADLRAVAAATRTASSALDCADRAERAVADCRPHTITAEAQRTRSGRHRMPPVRGAIAMEPDPRHRPAGNAGMARRARRRARRRRARTARTS